MLFTFIVKLLKSISVISTAFSTMGFVSLPISMPMLRMLSSFFRVYSRPVELLYILKVMGFPLLADE